MACFPVGLIFLDLLDQFVVSLDQSEASLDQLEVSPVEDYMCAYVALRILHVKTPAIQRSGGGREKKSERESKQFHSSPDSLEVLIDWFDQLVEVCIPLPLVRTVGC